MASESLATSPVLAHRHVAALLSGLVQPPTAPTVAPNASRGTGTGTCRPWDVKDYHARLDSFKIFMWFAKPGRISPAECARFGWRNTGVDRLQCVTCQSELAFPADVNAVTPEAQEAVTEFHGRLNSAHAAICPWRDNPCSEAFADPAPPNSDDAKAQFIARVRSIVNAVDHVPVVNREIVLSLERSIEGPLSDLAKLCDIPPTQKSLRACALAACGWEALTEPGQDAANTVTCRMCGRVLGLWNFRGQNDFEEQLALCESLPTAHLVSTQTTNDAAPESTGGNKEPAGAEDSGSSASEKVAVSTDVAASEKGGENGAVHATSAPSNGEGAAAAKEGAERDPVDLFLSFPSDIVADSSRGVPDGGSSHNALPTTPARGEKRSLEDADAPGGKRREVESSQSGAPSLMNRSPVRTTFGINAEKEHRWACPWVVEWRACAQRVALVRLLPRAPPDESPHKLKDAVKNAQRTLAMSTSF